MKSTHFLFIFFFFYRGSRRNLRLRLSPNLRLLPLLQIQIKRKEQIYVRCFFLFILYNGYIKSNIVSHLTIFIFLMKFKVYFHKNSLVSNFPKVFGTFSFPVWSARPPENKFCKMKNWKISRGLQEIIREFNFTFDFFLIFKWKIYNWVIAIPIATVTVIATNNDSWRTEKFVINGIYLLLLFGGGWLWTKKTFSGNLLLNLCVCVWKKKLWTFKR